MISNLKLFWCKYAIVGIACSVALSTAYHVLSKAIHWQDLVSSSWLRLNSLKH